MDERTRQALRDAGDRTETELEAEIEIIEKAIERSGIRYPNVEVQLSGEDSNAFAILGAVTKALRRAGVPGAEIDAFRREATSGDYNHLLATAMRWVDVS